MPCQLGSICLVRELLVRSKDALTLAVVNFSLNHQNNSVHLKMPSLFELTFVVRL